MKQVVKWTAEGAVKRIYPEYSATLQADVICRGYDGILLSARTAVNKGGTADMIYSPLTKFYDVVKGVFYVIGN